MIKKRFLNKPKNWRKSYCLSGLICALLLSPVLLSAEVPYKINVQGRLTDKNGVNIDGKYTVTFSIWDAAVNGNQKWEETQQYGNSKERHIPSISW
ncbi:MAG: hypothetical protein AB1349_11770 [Elusimicrobiota bacterium]